MTTTAKGKTLLMAIEFGGLTMAKTMAEAETKAEMKNVRIRMRVIVSSLGELEQASACFKHQ